MRNRYITEECNKILNFWKLEEYFTPSDYPELTLTIKEGKQDIPFDAYYNAYSTRSLPLKEYKAHNEYLIQKHKSDEKLYNRANVYCGCYKIKTFVEKMAEKCKLDMEKYAEINELSGRFYIFSVQIIIDESGQAMPQSALGALYRTRQAVVVGDPLQVEPVVTIPKVLIDILADSTGVANEYKVIENSVQTFADNMNEFNGMIGERQVGCPLVVHRRCIEPMFSISNMISYDNRMFNKTNKKEDYLKQEQPFLIKKSGWIDVEGTENGSKDHFVKNQAERVCQLLESALHIYTDLFDTDDKVFIITPFRTVAESMRKFVVGYFSAKGNDKEVLKKWTKKCVGTVHTFQGKDANEVIFVLGCSDKSVGAMNWVVKKANILNVACTRAKYRIAFIGNLNDWKNRRYFREFIPQFIDTIDV